MNPEETPLKQIRTFQGDVAEALKKQRESLVSIQQTEHLRRKSVQTADGKTLQDSNQKKFFWLFLGSLVLLVLGVIGYWYAYNEFGRRIVTPIATSPANRFVSVNTEVNLNLATTSRETFIKTLTDATEDVAAGEIRHVVPTKKGAGGATYLLTTDEFLERLGARAPGSLVRAFDPLFMFGAIGNSDFLIIKLVSFENAFAGMLAWEKTLAQDIGPLFANAKLLGELPTESVFTDITDRNKDARLLAIGEQPILLYSFFDNNMLIITDQIETLRTLVSRLTQEKLSR